MDVFLYIMNIWWSFKALLTLLRIFAVASEEKFSFDGLHYLLSVIFCDQIDVEWTRD